MLQINNTLNVNILLGGRAGQISPDLSNQGKRAANGGGPVPAGNESGLRLNDTTGKALANTEFVNEIKDTTGAILERMQSQWNASTKEVGSSILTPSDAEAKSLTVAHAISGLGKQGIVQGYSSFVTIL
jgi:hypothetical protein